MPTPAHQTRIVDPNVTNVGLPSLVIIHNNNNDFVAGSAALTWATGAPGTTGVFNAILADDSFTNPHSVDAESVVRTNQHLPSGTLHQKTAPYRNGIRIQLDDSNQAYVGDVVHVLASGAASGQEDSWWQVIDAGMVRTVNTVRHQQLGLVEFFGSKPAEA